MEPNVTGAEAENEPVSVFVFVNGERIKVNPIIFEAFVEFEEAKEKTEGRELYNKFKEIITEMNKKLQQIK